MIRTKSGIYRAPVFSFIEKHGGLEMSIHIHKWYYFQDDSVVYYCGRRISEPTFIVTLENMLEIVDLCHYQIEGQTLKIIMNKGKPFESSIYFLMISENEFIDDNGSYKFEMVY